jgi:hypothetical protein
MDPNLYSEMEPQYKEMILKALVVIYRYSAVVQKLQPNSSAKFTEMIV